MDGEWGHRPVKGKQRGPTDSDRGAPGEVAMEYLVDRIKELISPAFNQRNYDLVEITIKREQGRMILRILTDRPAGGITLDECVELNRTVSQILDEEDLILERFALEVSSPGLDRPLRTQKDFQRKLERQVWVFISEPVNQKLEWKGKLVKAAPGEITLLVNSAEVVIPLNKINKAIEVIG
jgi:ribosome maturation factor RimP